MAGLDEPRAVTAPGRILRRGVAASVAIALAVFGGAFGATSLAHADGPTTFTNSTAIAIPAAGSPDQTGPASPYPSNITVSGMAGAVTSVQVVFNNLTHSTLNDVDAMVVAPTGENLVVLSDIGDPDTTLAFATNATLTFDDAAAGGVPNGSVPTGTYRPTNSAGVESFPAPAPAPSTQTTLAGAFTGINPNGVWQLFIVDDNTGDVGSMAGGWSLVITTEVTAVATTTTVTTSATPSTTGDPVTFTAVVTAAGSPVTTGTVTFAIDGVSSAPVPVNASGIATLTTSSLTEGTHAIVGTYSGSTGFLTSNGSVTQRVDTETVVTGTTFCNPGPLAIPGNGPSTPYPSNITVSGLTGPIAKVTATLNGVSHAVPVDLDVLLSGPVPTTNVVLMSDAGGTAAVSGATVVFDDDAAGAVPTPLTSGTFRPTDDDSDAADAAFPAPAPAVSAATALATFNGGSGNGVWSLWVVDDATGDAGSISGGWCLTFTTVQSTITTLTSSANPSTAGQAVTFTATVTAGGSPVTTGSVAFTDGGTTLAAGVALDASGTATLTTSALSAGTHPIVADYSGAPAFTASTSNALSQVVDLAPTSTVITSSLNPSNVGQTVTFTATVSASGGPVATGNVAFADGGTTLAAGVALDASGTATFTTSALTAGAHSITASFAETAVYAASSATLDQVVNPLAVADAGGPYSIDEGEELVLDASASTPGATYEWDLDADGDFSDATGVAPTLTWTELEALGLDDGPATHTITVRVTQGPQQVTDTATLDIANVGPETVVTGSLTATAGVPFTIKVGADDPSSADMAGQFTYTVDWGDGSAVDSIPGPADPPATHTYVAAGTYSASLTATDKDGATGASLTVRVVVVAVPTPPPPPAPPGDDELPPTGADSTGPVLAAGLLLLVGAAMVVGRRRRS